MPLVSSADPPQRTHLPTLQGQVEVQESQEAQEEGVKKAFNPTLVQCPTHVDIFVAMFWNLTFFYWTANNIYSNMEYLFKPNENSIKLVSFLLLNGANNF